MPTFARSAPTSRPLFCRPYRTVSTPAAPFVAIHVHSFHSQFALPPPVATNSPYLFRGQTSAWARYRLHGKEWSIRYTVSLFHTPRGMFNLKAQRKHKERQNQITGRSSSHHRRAKLVSQHPCSSLESLSCTLGLRSRCGTNKAVAVFDETFNACHHVRVPGAYKSNQPSYAHMDVTNIKTAYQANAHKFMHDRRQKTDDTP